MTIGWSGPGSADAVESRELHGRLQSAAALLHAEMRAGRRGELGRVLATLEEATGYFHAEERRMRAAAYPRAADHAALHHVFTVEVEGFQRALDRDGPTVTLLVSVSQWLSAWMREHVRGEDVTFAQYAETCAPRPAVAQAPARFRR